METIFGLLFILLPVIFKLIGKKLEQSGKTGPIVEVLSETFDESSDEPAPEPVAKPVERPVMEFKPEPMPVYRPPKVEENVVRQTESSIQMEQKKKPAAEKIDPKKLVIYSEIMKPKFTE